MHHPTERLLSRFRASSLKHLACLLLFTTGHVGDLFAVDLPSTVILISDNTRARELPPDGSSAWSPPTRGDTTGSKFIRWNSVSSEHRAKRKSSSANLLRFNQVKTGRGGSSIEQTFSAPFPTPITCAATKNDDPKDGQPVLIFEDAFEGREGLGNAYVNKDPTGKAWTIKDGVLFASQVNPKHGCVMRKPMKFADLDVEFDFRFNGGKSFNFVVDDQKEKSVHAGHICRVSVFKNSIMVGDDKLGAMNRDVRAQRLDPNLPKAKQKALEELLKRTRASGKIKLESKQWHTLRVQIEGETMRAFLDGKLATELTSAGFAHPTKTQFGMTVNGSTIDFDNLKVYQNAADGSR